jgi:hypothetical protein
MLVLQKKIKDKSIEKESLERGIRTTETEEQ